MSDLLISIITSLISGLILGYRWSNFQRWKELLPFRKIWKPFLEEKEALIIPCTRPGPFPWSTHRLSFNEVQAYLECSILCKKLGINVTLEKSSIDLNSITNKNIILLGSPATNEVTKHFWDLISDKHPFVFVDENQEVEIFQNGKPIIKKTNLYYFKYKDVKYVPQLDESQSIENRTWAEDYGIIMRYFNPFNKNKAIIIAMGCHGFSTYGAMRMMTDRKYIKRILKTTNNKHFMVLVKFHLKNNKIIFSDDFPKILRWHIFADNEN